jgi:acyl homoserine lactone synthase/acyl-homoserine lactone synthase
MFGWACEALGQPLRHGTRWLRALHIVIDDQTIAGLHHGGVYAPGQFALHAPRAGRA